MKPMGTGLQKPRPTCHMQRMEIPPPGPVGQIEQLEPLVQRVLAGNPSPYTYTGTQTYIVGREDVAVIDPGPDEPHHIEALLAALEGRRVNAIACTHTHRDHSPAAAVLKARLDAPVIGCAPLVLDDSGPRADAAFDRGYKADRVLADGENITGEGWTLTAVATPGHTSNHLCYALEESGALFTGDHIMGWSTSVISPPDGDMAAYMDSLQKLIDRPQDKIYYPAHGAAVEKPHRLARGMMGHHKQREGQILRMLGEGPHALPDFVAEMYKGLDPRLHGAAGQSVLAHLLELKVRGRVEEVNEGIWRMVA